MLFASFLLEATGSDLSIKVREDIRVHLVLLRSNFNIRYFFTILYGKKTYLKKKYLTKTCFCCCFRVFCVVLCFFVFFVFFCVFLSLVHKFDSNE